jgi:hypothetical protein
LRKYYPKTGALNKRIKALYLSLIFDPRIKIDGLIAIGLTPALVIDIRNILEVEYNP